MALIKYAALVDFVVDRPGLARTAHRAQFAYEPRPGYLYIRSRAISSRCNDNYDAFPAAEIEKGYRSFIGKPVFVNHVNEDHRRARGVVIDAALHHDVNPDGSPDTWAEVLMEVDAQRFPKLARAIILGHVDRTSMGVDVEYSICSACGNKATTPAEYCRHIPQMKGSKIIRRNASTGRPEETLIFEECYGLSFFENSLLVEDPADPTAYFLGVDDRGLRMAQKTAVRRSGGLAGFVAADPRPKPKWRYDERDTKQQRAILKSNRSAQRARELFPPGTRVKPRPAKDEQPTARGTVFRHVPGNDAQGGTLVIDWDSGVRGRHGPISIERAEDTTQHNATWHSGADSSHELENGPHKTARYEPEPGEPVEGRMGMGPDPSGFYPNGIALKWHQDHHALVRDALHAWKGDPINALTHLDHEVNDDPQPDSGSGKKMRAQVGALMWEIHHNAKTFNRPLYRGQNISESRLPQVGDIIDHDHRPRGYSSNRATARGFAGRPEQDWSGQGRTVPVMFETAPGTHGLRVKNYLGGQGLDWSEQEHILAGQHRVTSVTPTERGLHVRTEPVESQMKTAMLRWKMAAYEPDEDLSNKSPGEIDASLGELHDQFGRHESTRMASLDTMHRLVGDKQALVRGVRRGPWGKSHAEVLSHDPSHMQAWDRDQWDRAKARHDEAVQGGSEAMSNIHRHEGEFSKRGGWSRFFLVPDGHIHSSMSCHSCRPTTPFQWLPHLSGKSEEEAVNQHGPHLCTHCFPSAPTEWKRDPAETRAEEKRQSGEMCAGGKATAYPDKEERRRRAAEHPQGKVRLEPGEAMYTGQRGGYQGRCPTCKTIQKVKNDGNFYQHKPPAPPKEEKPKAAKPELPPPGKGVKTHLRSKHQMTTHDFAMHEQYSPDKTLDQYHNELHERYDNPESFGSNNHTHTASKSKAPPHEAHLRAFTSAISWEDPLPFESGLHTCAGTWDAVQHAEGTHAIPIETAKSWIDPVMRDRDKLIKFDGRGYWDNLLHSMRTEGQREPIQVKPSGRGHIIWEGNHRVHAADMLGWSHVNATFTNEGEDPFPQWRKQAAKEEPYLTLYHGTSQATADKIAQEGFKPQNPHKVANEIEDRYGLERDSVWHHPHNEFSRGFRGENDPHTFFSGERRVAEDYARIGSEVVNDALNSAWHVIHKDDAFDDEGNYHSGKAQEKQQWVREETRKHYQPALITAHVPWSAAEPHINARTPKPVDYQRWQELTNNTANVSTLSLPGHLPKEWIHKVEPVEHTAGLARFADAWVQMGPKGQTAEQVKAKPVREAGFKGYVGHSDYEDEDPDDDDRDFDEDLYDRVRPEPTSAEETHYQHHDEYPESFYDRHDQAYADALEKKKQEDEPDHIDDHLHHWIQEHSTDARNFTEHAPQPQKVDLSHGVYATQSHVGQVHIDRYRDDPASQSWHLQQGGARSDYLGHDHPLFVTHQGRLHAIEGHHRVAAALQRGDTHMLGWHHDLDKHPIAGYTPEGHGCEECEAHYDWDTDAQHLAGLRAFVAVHRADEVPPPMGTSPIPAGHVRLFHQTAPDHVEAIRSHGLSMEHARDISGPRGVWCSHGTRFYSGDEGATVEFHVPFKELQETAGGQSPRRSDRQEDWEQDTHHTLIIPRSIQPHEISAIHLPWHDRYRYFHDNGMAEDVKKGEYDNLENMGDYGPAIRKIKSEGSRHVADMTVDKDLWRQERPADPDYDHLNRLNDQGRKDEARTLFDTHRDRQKAWDESMRQALSLGHISPEGATAKGFKHQGDEKDYGERDFNADPERYPEGRPYRGWQRMPDTMYHVTTNAPAVRRDGLKTRYELDQARGVGLGGGTSNTVSFTTDEGIAQDIHRGMHEMRQVARGERTIPHMIEEAKAGKDAERPFWDDIKRHYGQYSGRESEGVPANLDRIIRGVHSTLDDAKLGAYHVERPGPEWHPAPGARTWTHGETGETLAEEWQRPHTAQERLDHAIDFHKTFAYYRDHAGGPKDPLFISHDPEALAQVPKHHIQILKVHPKPGALGYPMGSMKEWRTSAGGAVDVEQEPVEPTHHLAKGSPQTYFHGTTEELAPGDIVRPGNELGLKTHPQLQHWRGEHVWATPSEEGAWGYSGQAEHQRGTHHQYSPNVGVGTRPRPRVYEVEPLGPVQKRRRLSPFDPEEYTMPAARVLRSIDIPHPEVPSSSQGKWGEQGTQGRLPGDKSWENWKTLEPDAKDLAEHWELSQRRHPEAWAKGDPEPEEQPDENQGRFFASLRACMAALHMADEPDYDIFYHLTDQHHFAPDPERHPTDNAFAIQDRSHYKGLYVGNPEAWTANGYHRPYVAEIHAPKDLAHNERWHGEKFIPAEHFDQIKVHRVIPYDAYVREQYGSHGPYEEHAGKEFDTGKKIEKTNTGTWHDHYPFHYTPEGEQKEYEYSGKDVRDFTPAQHTQHLKRLRNYLHEVKGFGWNEFNDKHEHVGVPDQDYDNEGMEIRRDRKGRVMTRDRYATLVRFVAAFEGEMPEGQMECRRCYGTGTSREFVPGQIKSQEVTCPTCGGLGHHAHADWEPAQVPKEQSDLLGIREFEGATMAERSRLRHQRVHGLIDLAANPVPHTHVWRGEMRDQGEDLDHPDSVGMHWTVNPDYTITGRGQPGKKSVHWQAEGDDSSTLIPRSHAMWFGKHRSLEAEAEQRHYPGSKLHITGRYEWEGDGDEWTAEGQPIGSPHPRHPESTHHGWKFHPMDHWAEVRHKGNLIDYSDVGLTARLRAFVAAARPYIGKGWWLTPEGKKIGVYDHYETTPGMARSEIRPHMAESGQVRVRSFNNQLNIQTSRPFTDRQRQSLLMDADKHARIYVDVLHPDTEESIHSEAGGPEEADRMLARAHRAAVPHTAKKVRKTEWPQKCEWCKQPATKSMLWAEGMGYIPTCDDHEQKTRDHIEKTNNDEVVAVHQIRKQADQPYAGGFEFRFTKARPGGMEAQADPLANYHRLDAFHSHTQEVTGGRAGHAGYLLWHHGTGMIGNIGVNQHFQRQGLATELLARARQIAADTRGVKPPRHSPQRTDAGEAWARSTGDRLPRRVQGLTGFVAQQEHLFDPGEVHDPHAGHLANPLGGYDWHHGTPHDFQHFDEEREYDGDYDETPEHNPQHWNTHLGQHWTSIERTAEKFAKGKYGQYAEGSGHVFTANLGIKHPKHYDMESDLDTEAFNHAWDGHDPENIHDQVCHTCPPRPKDEDDFEDPYEHHWLYGRPATDHLDHHRLGDEVDTKIKQHYYEQGGGNGDGWLSDHPDAALHAEEFKQHLRDQGHDGITYGNANLSEGPIGHKCAITFDTDQIHNLRRRSLSRGAAIEPHPDSYRTLYRGLHFGELEKDKVDDFHKDPEKYLKEYGQWHGNVGIHWTDNPDSAYNFATDRDPEGWAHENDEYDEDEEHGHNHGVILEGRVHNRHIIDPESEEGQGYAMSDAIFGHEHPENEVTVRGDARVHVHTIHAITEHPDQGDRWTTHKVRQHHLAGLADDYEVHGPAAGQNPGLRALALTRQGELVGGLTWHAPGEDDSRRIDAVWVHPDHRRRGLASYMKAEAERREGYRLRHSSIRTEVGDAWAKGVGGAGAHNPKSLVLPDQEEGSYAPAFLQHLRTKVIHQAGLESFVAAWEDDDDSGDGYVHLPDGSVRWGLHGAAGILLHHQGEDGQHRYMLQHRSGAVQQGGTWSTPGGALHRGEDPFEGAKRELREETGVKLPEGHKMVGQHVSNHQGWTYTTSVVDVPHRPQGHTHNWESQRLGWFTPEEMSGLNLHPGFKEALPHLLKHDKTGAKEYFHGSPHLFEPGQILQPGRDGHVYFAGNRTEPSSENYGAHLYQVEPTGEFETDPALVHIPELESLRTRHPMRVVKRLAQHLFDPITYEPRCSKCGHGKSEHGGSRGFCHAQEGPYECKCGGFTPLRTAVDEDWRGLHQPSDGPPIHDLLEPPNEHHDWTAPDDIYTHMHYYRDGEDAWDNESHQAIREAHKDRVAPGTPQHQQLVEKYGQDYADRRHARRQAGDHLVTIYRAAPKGLTHIGTGDWVTPSKSYARQHGVHATDADKDWPVYKAKVPARHVRWAGDSLNEFGYQGPPVEAQVHYRGGRDAERLAAVPYKAADPMRAVNTVAVSAALL